MATRGVIARRTGETTFAGRYHHWDSYPKGLGATLWALYHGHFDRDLEAMLAFLIDEHPAGWSTINGRDFALPAGCGGPGPECYCHGERAEEGYLMTQANAQASGAEYAYVFDVERRTMLVLASYTPDGHKMIGMFGMGDENAHWQTWAEIDLDGEEPDWSRLGWVEEPEVKR